MKLKLACIILLMSILKSSYGQEPISLIATTLIPKLVEGANAVIDKVRENKAATKEKVRDKTQGELDKALRKMQQENAENLENLSNAIKVSNGKVTELKKIYENTKEILYPLGNLQALTNGELHQAIANSTDLKKPFISNYISVWNDIKPYFDNITKLQDDDQWTDESNKMALINDVKTTFQRLNAINGIVSKIREPAPATPDADIELYRKAIAGSDDEIEETKKAVIKILDLLTARLSISKNEADDLIKSITAQKNKIVVP